ncbi:CBS domain-containing protein [Allopontixanthobacter sp.]|uniref:CBS domain-containing protein n=1 Tax=Allopontixanthobacter sp. TaxID=2906452 RepID=UPI002ABAB7B8|nr:CBS domain-containing protein [Allopontixanthobacter sp.]MDZ4307026.1 CBS domain-containing protein [Allopontixanthobacter sp.]
MKISQILAAKGTSTRSIGHDQNFGKALAKMHEAQIGSIVVVHADSGALLGLVSQPEILAGLTTFGSSSMTHCVTGMMRKPAPVCDPDDDIRSVMSQMTRDRCRHTVVTGSDSSIQGVVSIGDLVAAQLQEARLEANVLRDMARSHLLPASL